MKIAVFGDSFAERTATDIWWQFLQSHHAHQVTSFGEGRSSIAFSAALVNRYATNYDFVIWCVTGPGRLSLKNNDHSHCHYASHLVDHRPVLDSQDTVSDQQAAYHAYLRHIFDFDDEVLVGKALVHYLLASHDNLMVIPCFLWPLESVFNLYTVSEREAQHCFPGQDLCDIYRHYADQREGHISPDNQLVLAELVNQNLEPGTFTSGYEPFVVPTASRNHLFKAL